MTVTADEIQSHFSDYLAGVQRGEEVIIEQGNLPVARLVAIGDRQRNGRLPDIVSIYSGPRPKVGEMIDAPMHIDPSVFAPLTDRELEEWGL